MGYKHLPEPKDDSPTDDALTRYVIPQLYRRLLHSMLEYIKAGKSPAADQVLDLFERRLSVDEKKTVAVHGFSGLETDSEYSTVARAVNGIHTKDDFNQGVDRLHALFCEELRIQDELNKVANDYVIPSIKASQQNRYIKRHAKILQEIKVVQKGLAKANSILLNRHQNVMHRMNRRYANSGIPEEDRINEINIGMLEGILKYVPGRGSFQETLKYYVKNRISDTIFYRTRTIRTAKHAVQTLFEADKQTQRFYTLYGRDPTTEELSQLLKMPLDLFEKRLDALKHTRSLDHEIGEEDSITRHELVEDKNTYGEAPATPLEMVVAKELSEGVRELLKAVNLRPKQQDVIKLHYGLCAGSEIVMDWIEGSAKLTPEQMARVWTGEELNLQQIGDVLGVTRERARQIKNDALNKIKKRKCELEMYAEAI